MLKRKQADDREADKKRLKSLIEQYTGIKPSNKDLGGPQQLLPQKGVNVSQTKEEEVLAADDEDRLFVALPIPDEVQYQVYKRLQKFAEAQDCTKCIWQKGIMMHMTLSFVGKTSRADVLNRLAGFAHEEVKVSLSEFSNRGTAKLRLMTAPNQDLVSLAKSVIDRTEKGDIKRFKGHISLAVLRDCDQGWVDEFNRQVKAIDLSDISWVANEICVFSSLTRPYEIIHRVNLKRTPDQPRTRGFAFCGTATTQMKAQVEEKPVGKRIIVSTTPLRTTNEQQNRLGMAENVGQAYE